MLLHRVEFAVTSDSVLILHAHAQARQQDYLCGNQGESARERERNGEKGGRDGRRRRSGRERHVVDTWQGGVRRET